MAAVAAAVAGAVLPTTPAPAGTDPWQDAVQQVLDDRADAVEAKDREAFLGTVDPEAEPAFRDAQERLFEGISSAPLNGYRLALESDQVRDLSQGVTDDLGADEVRLPLVEERFRLDGIDAVDSTADLWLTFVRRGERWFVNDDADLQDLGLLTQRHLWSFGPVTLTRGDEIVVMSSPEDAERARALSSITADALRRLRESLAWPTPPRVLVVLPRSTSQLEEILQTNFDLTNFVAFATSDVDRSEDSGGWSWTAPRVYVQESNLATHSRDFQVETLHHELVHVVAFDKAGPHVPNWLHEGHADYLALGRPRPSAVRGTDGRLPLDFEFVTGGRERILRSYRESTSVVSFLGERLGPEGPSQVFERLGAVRVEPGTWRYHLDRVLEEVTGTGLAELEADWDGGR